MIRIQQLRIRTEHTREELERKIGRILHLGTGDLLGYEIRKRSVDARKKPDLYFSYVIDCLVRQEEKVLKRADAGVVCRVSEAAYRFPPPGGQPATRRPVIIGTGPAGLFCGLMLAAHGYRPVLLERGQDVDTRLADVETFWHTGTLNPESNVQFGEGGAGTFSDGKLNTLVKDKDGRNREVLRMFAEAGADASVLYESKPHIGTDALIGIVKNMRRQIEDLGGSVRFGAKVTDILSENGHLTGVVINDSETLPCDTAVLATGHSARDTFQMLYDRGVEMEAKEFAVGFRVEHRQTDVNLSQYGRADPAPLQAAPYKVTAKAANGRGVYSFCMCPGGYVVNASSEPGRLAVNGMSYHARDSANANSAIIVSVKKSDFPSAHPLAGVAFQRKLEEAAYAAGGGSIPVQRLADFRSVFETRTKSGVRAGRTGRCNTSCKTARNGNETVFDKKRQILQPCHKGAYVFADITEILPAEMTAAFLDGMERFSHMIEGFAADDTLISAVESRTSSPVRVVRDTAYESSLQGLYPCGEGAGYAGGITSAAMDGLRVAEAIAAKFAPFLQEGRECGGAAKQEEMKSE